MARAAKKETVLTPEEKLAQALVPEEDQPYQVPENWCWTRIKYLCELKNGRAFKPTEWSDYGLPIIRIQNLNNPDNEYNCFDGEVAEDNRLYGGELLFAWSGTPGTSFGAHIWCGKDAVLNQHIFRVDFDESAINKYFFKYAINQQLDMLISAAHGGAGLQHVTKGVFESTPIAFPPFAEQQRIVDRIESLFAKLDEAKEKAQTVVDGFEDRKAAILHKAFTGALTKEWRKNNLYNVGEYYCEIQDKLSKSKKKSAKKVQNEFAQILQHSIPSEWVLVDLDSISRIITDGEHKTPNRVESFCGFYLLSARNILNDSLRLDDVDYIDADEYEVISKRCNPKKGDILLSCSGSVGRCCVVNDTNNYCMVRSAAMISQEGCNSRFLMYMIQSDAVQEQISKLSKQTAQANLFLGAIASLVVPLPSKEEQDEMTKILDALLSEMHQVKETAEQVVDQIDIMKKSILARAFRGELGTNDPSDESAEELLKRIL